ncbi:hypothetical protein GCM10023225_33210 [Kineococcus glutinatus]|uniref:Uncharacterized protein n=1 Tax=Kineococcus glutinatus TaxID=1070872 RepID=A0ABP8VCV7_9ACTN
MSTRGSSSATSSGAAHGSHRTHPGPAPAPRDASGSTATTSSTAVVIDTSSATASADPVRRRGTPWSRPSSACARNCHTVPGTYRPSWPTKNTAAADRHGSREPRSASTARHDAPLSATFATDSASAAAALPASRRPSAAPTASRSRATATTARARARARNPTRTARARSSRAGTPQPRRRNVSSTNV